jgi:hypothetical protein
MNDLLSAACEVQQFLEKREWKFCIIGGLALARWGQPRATADVDITLLTGYGDERQYVDALLEQFRPRIENAHDFAVLNRVLLLKASNGIGIDIALAGFPFEERVIDRASNFEYSPTAPLMTASADDLVVLKAFADRPQDWIDIQGILVRQGDNLNWKQILAELSPLCELKESSWRRDRAAAE